MSADRDRRVRRQPLLEHAQPALQIAELDERPADERRGPVHLLRDPVRVADDGELLVGALDLARRAPGEMHEHLEEQRERQRLRVIERAGGGHGLLDDGEPGVGKSRAASSCARARSGRRCRARCRSARRARRETPGRRASWPSRGAGVRPRARRDGRAPRRPTTRRSSAGAGRRGARRAPSSRARCRGRCGSRPRRYGAPTCR